MDKAYPDDITALTDEIKAPNYRLEGKQGEIGVFLTCA
jgi:hypothetical protein